jgi:hypothetical protein
MPIMRLMLTRRLRYLRFFGRTTGRLRAGRKHVSQNGWLLSRRGHSSSVHASGIDAHRDSIQVENQMMMSQRLLVGAATSTAAGVGGEQRAQTARRADQRQPAPPMADANAMEAEMQTLLNTGREWLLALPPLRGV